MVDLKIPRVRNKKMAIVFIVCLSVINICFVSKYMNLSTRRWIFPITQSYFTEHAAKSLKDVALFAAEISDADSIHKNNFSGIKLAVPARIIHHSSANKYIFISDGLSVDNTSVATEDFTEAEEVNALKFAEGDITWIDPPGSFMERLPPYN